MTRILSRPLTVADMARIEKEVPEELIALGRMAAARWVARRRKTPGRRKGHAPE